MALHLRRVVVSLATAFVAGGCVTLHTPLQPDNAYPEHWGALMALGPECKNVNGTYLNDGDITTENGRFAPVLLTSVLNIPSDARTAW